MMLVLTVMAQSIQKHQYWLDSDFDHHKTVYGSSLLSLSVSIEGLPPGVHFFNHRAMDSDDTWGTIYRTPFYIPSDPTSESTIQSYEYWIDSDYDNRKSDSGSTIMQATVDISSLAAGVHFFNYRALSSNGSWGTIYRTLFYIPEGEIENPEIVEYEYWIDDDSEKKLSGTGNMDTYQLTIDVSQLAAGEHLFSFRAKNTNGEWSQLYQSTFTVDEPPAMETIVFADANVKAICVDKWDTDGDGELSMDEAAVVTSLESAFKGNKNITSFDELQYFTGLTTIDSWAFSNCTAMQSVVLPESVTEIGENAFYNCPLIETLKIPAAVQTIGGSALARMTGLKTLTVDAASAYFTVEDDVLYTKDMSRLVCCLPGKIGTVTVNSKTKVLGECAFYLCEQLSSIILPEGLTTLEDGVFQGVTSMTEITLPASVVNMGVGCFYCPQLKAVKVAPGNLQYKSEDGVLYSKNGETLVYYPTARQGASYTVLDGTKTIDKYAFTVSLIQEVTLPESILLIDVGAFQDCGNMTTITCLAVEPPTVMSKGFYGDNFQYATVRVPYGSKDKYAVADVWEEFTNIVELDEPVFPEPEIVDMGGMVKWASFNVGATSLTETGRYIGWGDPTGLMDSNSPSDYAIGNAAKDIGGNASYDVATAKWGKHWRLPTKAEYEELFANTTMTYDANSKCFKLTSKYTGNSLYLPVAGLTNTSNEMINPDLGCYWTSEAATGTTSYMTKIDNTGTPTFGQVLISTHMPIRAVYAESSEWSGGDNIVFADANVKAICVANWDTNGDGELSMDEAAVVSSLGDVFRNKDITSFDELQYFTGLTTIENRTFFYCGSLTSIFIPIGVTTIGEGAFYACSSLISIVIPSNVISIGEGAFNGCSALTSISVESSNTVYDSRGNCNAIIKKATNELVEGCKKTIIPNSVTSIGDYAFGGCRGLTSITIPDGVTTIGESAFNWCTDLTSVTIGNGVKSIGENAFYNCSNLTAVHISDLKVWCNIIFSKRNWLLSNAQHLFINGIEVTDLVIPDGVTAINSCAFEYCSGLTSVIIPNSVTLIDDGAFWGCYNLTTVTIPNSVTTLGDAFNDCYDIKTIVSMIEEPFALSASTFTNAVYNTATLIVPTGTKAKYQVTGGWWKFKHIVEMEPENTPGDLSGDNEVNGTDLVMLTQLVLNAEYNAVADLNNDGVVNGTDFVLMVNIILNINPATAREESRTKALTAGLAIEDFTIRAGETRKMLISLINPDTRITLGQFDLRLPTGLSIVSEDGEIAVSIAGRTSERRHALSTLTRDGVTRFLLASDMNEPVSGTDGAVISVTVTASSDFCGGDILLENQLLVTPEADEIKPFTYTYTLGAVTGVCASAVDGYVEVFTMTGSKVNTGGGGLKALPKGVYIVNGKKVIVK